MKTIKSILIFLSTFAGVIIFFEFFLSYAGILSPIVRIDPRRGERYIPNITCSSIFVAEGFGLAKTNSSGWFGHEFKDTGPDDLSVAVLGNSFVAARHVFYRNNFLSLSEKQINSKLKGRNVSFFNFGKEDFPLKELLFVKDDIAKTNNPDYFIVLINPGVFNHASTRYVAHYEMIDGQFQVDSSFQNAPFVKNYQKFEFATKSSFLFLMHRVKNHSPNTGSILFDKFYLGEKPEDADHNTSPDTISMVDKAIIKRLSEDKRVIFMLNLDLKMTSMVKLLIGQSPVIELRQPLLDMQAKTGIDPYYWEISDKKGHWNLEGHKAIAKEIERRMLELINPLQRHN